MQYVDGEFTIEILTVDNEFTLDQLEEVFTRARSALKREFPAGFGYRVTVEK